MIVVCEVVWGIISFYMVWLCLMFCVLAFGYWHLYISYLNEIFAGSEIIVYLILIVGLIVTIIGGSLIAIGLRIIVRPEFYQRIQVFIRSE